ncbi:hypothetical protein [Moorena bouillonii]|uniref:hypothetical protein n=1 Tax=Moorena bouillonii TaxID=207920 RepID=UPI001300EBA8|nr:hypothetical protein [Moorena bouillonii]
MIDKILKIVANGLEEFDNSIGRAKNEIIALSENSMEISITLMANSPRFPIPDSRLPIP